MPATIIMGGQWGDEGKGKLTDALAAKAHLVVRANGGSNAGHTIETPAGVFKMHLIPSGILYSDCTCVVGAGVVVDPLALVREMDELQSRGISLRNLTISDRAHVVLPFHPLLDGLEEDQREDELIGTTRTGNGPAYADKAARRGIRIVDLIDVDGLEHKIARAVNEKNQIIGAVYGQPLLDAGEVYMHLAEAGRRLREHVVPAEVIVQDALADGKQVLVECAQGAMLDVDYGSYPYVTSSSPTAAGACQGAGIAPTQVTRVLAVFKAYSTRVGSGPLPTELHDTTGQIIRDRGREYGTTTGRPRRTGWFDAVAARHVTRMNGVSEIALTLLDVLDAFESIDICTGYRLGDRVIRHMPARADLLRAIEPVYTSVSGWQEETTGARIATELPAGARRYVAMLEQLVGAPITMAGVGPAREQLVPLDAGASFMPAEPEVVSPIA